MIDYSVDFFIILRIVKRFRLMKNFILITLAASLAMLCSSNMVFAAVPEGYKALDFPGFTVSIPNEFEKSEGWSSESQMSFNSNAVNVRDDGDEYLSSATISLYEMETDMKDLNLNEAAQNMMWAAKAMDEVCDEPIVEGNTVILRSTIDTGYGLSVSWRFIVINEDGKTAGGTISYHEGDTKVYQGIVRPIIQSIQFK